MVRLDPHIYHGQMLPHMVVTAIPESHAKSKTVLGLDTNVDGFGSDKAGVNGVSHRHTVNDGAICFKAAVFHESYCFIKEFCLRLFTFRKSFDVFIGKINRKMSGHIQTKSSKVKTGRIYNIRSLRIYIDIPLRKEYSLNPKAPEIATTEAIMSFISGALVIARARLLMGPVQRIWT